MRSSDDISSDEETYTQRFVSSKKGDKNRRGGGRDSSSAAPERRRSRPVERTQIERPERQVERQAERSVDSERSRSRSPSPKRSKKAKGSPKRAAATTRQLVPVFVKSDSSPVTNANMDTDWENVAKALETALVNVVRRKNIQIIDHKNNAQVEPVNVACFIVSCLAAEDREGWEFLPGKAEAMPILTKVDKDIEPVTYETFKSWTNRLPGFFWPKQAQKPDNPIQEFLSQFAQKNCTIQAQSVQGKLVGTLVMWVYEKPVQQNGRTISIYTTPTNPKILSSLHTDDPDVNFQFKCTYLKMAESDGIGSDGIGFSKLGACEAGTSKSGAKVPVNVCNFLHFVVKFDSKK